MLVRIVFETQKMNEYKYRIPLFGPNYWNSRIVRIIRPNTDLYLYVVWVKYSRRQQALAQSFLKTCLLEQATGTGIGDGTGDGKWEWKGTPGPRR